jgi:hypothetical protein
MTIQEYISEIQRQFATGVAQEHTYRPALQNLLASMLPHLTVANESVRQDALDVLFLTKTSHSTSGLSRC